jgi:hypothetical protein
LGSRLGYSYGGPFELACVAGGLAYLSWYRLRMPLLAAAFLGIVAISAARITVAVVGVLLVWALVRLGRRRLEVLLAAVGCALIAVLLVPRPSNVGLLSVTIDRFSETGIVEEVEASERIADALPGPARYDQVAVRTVRSVQRAIPPTSELDRSALIRFTRWRMLVERQHQSVWTTLVGLGPGAGTGSVDGYYVRLLVEGGWLGLGFYGFFLFSLLYDARRAEPAFRTFVILMVASAVFVDVLVAAKAMTLLWMLHAHRAGNRSGGSRLGRLDGRAFTGPSPVRT